MRCAGVDRAEHGDAVRLEVERVDEDDRADQRNQGAGDAPVDAGADDHDAHDAEPHGERAGLDLGKVVDHVEEPVLVRAGCRRQAEEVGQLVDDDDDGDAREEARRDRGREEVGDPPEPKEADKHHHQPDHHGEDADELDVVRRSQRGESDDPGGEEGGDRRVRAHRHLGVGAEEGEQHRAGDERVETGDRRHAGEARRRQLLGQSDGEEGQARDEIRAGPGAAGTRAAR